MIIDETNIWTTEFTIDGMTCSGCEEHLNYEINKMMGIFQSRICCNAQKRKLKWKSNYNQQSLAPTVVIRKKKQCRQPLVNIFTNVKNANKYLNQNKATAVCIVVTEMLLVHQSNKTKNVAKNHQ